MKKGGIESSAEWAAVASHENAHARGFLEERDAHMSGLATYLGVTKNLGIKTDEKLVTEMLFGAIMNDNSANEDGVYHWTLALKDDGSGTYGWREDGSLDFNISYYELLNNSTFMEKMGPKGDELKELIQNGLIHPNDNSDGLTLTIGYETMNEGLARTLGAYLGMGKSDGEVTMYAPGGSYPPAKDLQNFMDGTMALKDVSTAYENAIQSIANRESDKVRRAAHEPEQYDDASVQKSLNELFASLVSADATGILVKNQNRRYADPGTVLYSAKDESFPMALNEGETTFRITSQFGRQAYVDGGNIIWRLHSGIDVARENEGGVSHSIIASRSDDVYTLNWEEQYGLRYSTALGDYLGHLDSSTLKTVISLWGTDGIKVDSNRNIYGILQNQIIGLTGSTGTKSTGIHLDFRIKRDGYWKDPMEEYRRCSSSFQIDDPWGGLPVNTKKYSPEYWDSISNPQIAEKYKKDQKILIDDYNNYMNTLKQEAEEYEKILELFSLIVDVEY